MPAGTKTPLAALIQGLAAGVVGTAAFTGYQALIGKDSGQAEPRRWTDAPASACSRASSSAG